LYPPTKDLGTLPNVHPGSLHIIVIENQICEQLQDLNRDVLSTLPLLPVCLIDCLINYVADYDVDNATTFLHLLKPLKGIFHRIYGHNSCS
jgi:hypothetical protein